MSTPGRIAGRSPLSLFALGWENEFGARVAASLDVSLAPHEEREFEWGQHKTRPLLDVRGHDVHVVASLHGDERRSVNDRLCRLLFFLATLRDADAARVTAIVPFLCYARKDRRTQARDPVTTRYVAQLFEAVGVDHVATIEVHDVAAFENAFRCPTTHIDPAPRMCDVLAHEVGTDDLAVVSPDTGGIKRAARYRDALARRLGRPVASAFVEKYRSLDVVSGGAVVGPVAGRTVLLVDDLIVGGTTLARAATACRDAGAVRVIACAAHGAFVDPASSVLETAPIERVYVLDHIPPAALTPAFVETRLRLIDSPGLIAATIRDLSAGDQGAAPPSD